MTERQVGIGIDVGGTKVLLVALDEAGTLLGERRVDSPAKLEGLRDVIAPALVELAHNLDGASVAVGLALPGLVDANGVLRSAPNLDARDVGFDLHRELADPLVDRLGARAAAAPVALENDATAAAFGEVRLGGGRGHDEVLVVSIGTGIGAGMVSGGRLIRGSRGYAGEIGHMIVDPDGPPCGCGRRGCWEALASGPALAVIARRVSGTDVRGEDVVDAARRGEPSAQDVIEEYAGNVALGLVNACELLDPAVVVLGGGLVTASDVILGPIRAAFERIARPAQERRGADLVPATLGPRAAAIGVALVALGLGG